MAAAATSAGASERVADEKRLRRENRHKLRGMINKTRREAEELQKPESDQLEKAVDEADEVWKQMQGKAKARELVLDAQLYGQLAAYSLERTKRLGPRGSAEVSVAAFLQCLARKYVQVTVEDASKEAEDDASAFQWGTLGTATAKYFREASVPGFMNGVIDTEIKERRVAQRRAKEIVGPSIAPDTVADTAAEKQTDRMMVAMNKKLKKQSGGSTNVVHAMNNPEDFPQFVENVFTAAFLVKDGHAGIIPAADQGVPTFSHTVPPPSSESDRSSFVLHMDMTNWKALAAMMNQAEGMMPTREMVDDDTLYGNKGVRPANVHAKNEVETKKRSSGAGLSDSTNKKARQSFSVST